MLKVLPHVKELNLKSNSVGKYCMTLLKTLLNGIVHQADKYIVHEVGRYRTSITVIVYRNGSCRTSQCCI